MKKKKHNYEYWNAVWTNDDYSRDSLRRIKAARKVSILHKYIPIKDNWKVVDFGSGPAYVSEALFNVCPCLITCVDSSEIALTMAKNRLNSYPFSYVFSDVCSSGLPGSSFDLALCCGIIEHVRERDHFLAELNRVIKDNGYLYVVSSNRYSMIWPQRLIKQLLHIWPFGYQVNLPIHSLSQLIHDHGFEIINTVIINDIGDYRMLGKIDRWLSQIIPSFGRYIVLVCRKESYI